MQKKIRRYIEIEYGIKIKKIEIAPRQFVAETWFIETDSGIKYFVKVVEKPLFIPEIIKSLPVLDAMHKAGINRINWPLRTISGKLFLKKSTKLIVLYNAIDAPQSYNYSEKVLGRLLAKIHEVTKQIKISTPEENYEFTYKDLFEYRFNGIINGQLVTDDINKQFKKLLREYEKRIIKEYKRLANCSKKMKRLDLPKVITHGDAGGNALVKSFTDIYIIDWDGILFAPRERDIWVPGEKFLQGYRDVVPDFSPNPTSIAFYILTYYFRSIVHYMGEIISEKSDEHRKKNLYDIEHELFKGWMVPYLEQIDFV
ncbi:phosphotransferase [Candidatus Dojkabacteria bacterium]|nr:phosphotransferase [Candidatus Dojkabacteria bacterium]